MHSVSRFVALVSLTLCVVGCVKEEEKSAKAQPSPTQPSPTQPTESAEPAEQAATRPARTRLIYTPTKKVADKTLTTKKIPPRALTTKKLPAGPLTTKKPPAKADPTQTDPTKAPAGGVFVLHEGSRAYRFAWIDSRGKLAARRKLIPGDTLVQVNGRPLGKTLSQSELFKVLLSDSIKSLTVQRQGRRVALKP